MTIGKLRQKMAKLREEHEEAEIEGGELNLVPYLDIVTNVIMFLMMTISYSAALVNVNVASPKIAAGGPSSDEQPKEDLNLTVSISGQGFTIAAAGGVLYENDVPGKLPTIPIKGTEYDYPALTKRIIEIKDKVAGEETKVILNANSDIKYQTLISTMDAIRAYSGKMLFPDVTLSAGVN